MDIIIVDAAAAVRVGLESLFAGQNQFRVVLSTGNIEEALAYLSRRPADLVFIDPYLLGHAHATRLTPPKINRNSLLTEATGPVMKEQSGSGAHAGDDRDDLSDREIQVLELLRQGHTKKSLADKLCISCHTVKTHTTNIYRKLQAKSRAEAVYTFFWEQS